MLKYLVAAHAGLKYEPECSSKPDPYSNIIASHDQILAMSQNRL